MATTATSSASAMRAGRAGDAEQAADAAVDQACRMLRLPTMRARFSGVADSAQREHLTYRGFLAELLMAECNDRDRRRSARRSPQPRFPREKGLHEFDYAANPHIQPAVISQLAACGWVSKGEPLCLIGDSSTGKSNCSSASAQPRRWPATGSSTVLAARLVDKLVEAADERQLSETITRYGRVDLVCLDELGCMELDRLGAELLFQVLTGREETNSVAIASNGSFSGRTKTFTDPRLCAAIVDHPTFGSNIIETGTTSYRLAQARTQRASQSEREGDLAFGLSAQAHGHADRVGGCLAKAVTTVEADAGRVCQEVDVGPGGRRGP